MSTLVKKAVEDMVREIFVHAVDADEDPIGISAPEDSPHCVAPPTAVNPPLPLPPSTEPPEAGWSFVGESEGPKSVPVRSFTARANKIPAIRPHTG